MTNTKQSLPEGLKKALEKDFNNLYVRQFTADWEGQRFVRGLEIGVMGIDNLRKVVLEYVQSCMPEKKDVFDHEDVTTGTLEAIQGYNQGISDFLEQLEEGLNG